MRYKLYSMIIMLSCCLIANASHHEKQQERLDSIVMNGYWNKKKYELCYNGKGEVEQVLYYKWDDGDWSLANRREYFYDDYGNDTLCILSHRKNGQWQIAERRVIARGSRGEKRQEWTIGYVDGKASTQSRWDFIYNDRGEQLSASEYREEQGVWRKRMTVQDEYDLKGNQVKEVYEDLNTGYPRKGCTILCYNEDGILTMQVDSICDGRSEREWRRRDFFYNTQGLSMVKETLTTIEHDAVQQTMEESLFDPQGNIVQTRFYRQDHGEWQHVRSVSYVYDLNREASSIRGYRIRLDALGIETNEQFRSKLLKRFTVEMDENGDEETFETCFYYSELSPKQ